MNEHEEKHEAEKEFWDEDILRSRLDFDDEDLIIGPNEYYDKLRPHSPFLGLDRIYQKSVDQLGNVEGKKILDCGCGNGFMTSLLAKKGAFVTSIDISPKSVEMTRYRAKLNKVEDRVEAILMNAEELNFDESSFDHIFGSFVLHHTDVQKTGEGIKSALKPGGKGIFIETSGRNSLLMWARSTLTGKMGIPKYGTKTEAPLSSKEILTLQNIFGNESYLHYPTLIFFRMAAGYLKPLSGPRASAILSWMDRVTGDFSNSLKKYSYYMVVEVRK